MVSVSVIMPVYNAEKFLNKSIGSFQNQTLEDKELICVDDGSTDSSLEILKGFQEEYNNIKIVTQDNSGPGIARNTGIQNAEGEYIAFLDSDDIFLDDTALEEMFNLGLESGFELICANLRRINQDYTLDEHYDFFNSRFTYFTKSGVFNSEDYGIPFAFYKNIFKRTFLEENNIVFPDLRFGEDPVFMVNVLAHIEQFQTLAIDFYGYNHSIGGGVNEKITTFEKKYAYIKHFKDIFDILIKNNLFSILSTYKKEFIDYLIYSDNIHDEEINDIVKDLFSNFEHYFEKDEYGYFIMDYIVNREQYDMSASSQESELNEFLEIKKYFLEEASVSSNLIDIDVLRDYYKYISKNDIDLDDGELKKQSFNELIKINNRMYVNQDSLEEDIENLTNDILAPSFNRNAEFLRKYLEARIDIKNFGVESNDIALLSCDDSTVNITNPNWFKDEEGVGTVIHAVNNELNFSFKCINEGKVQIAFKGIDYSDKKGNRIPIYIDYTEIVIDDETLIEDSRVSWHDNPFIYEEEVEDGQIINVQVKWFPFTQESNIYTMTDDEKLINNFYRARIDVKNSGSEENRLILLECDDPASNIYEPSWLNDEEGIGTVIYSVKGDIDVSFKCVNDGKLEIDFKAQDLRDKNKNKIPIFIDYNEIVINGKYIFGGSSISWHDDAMVYAQDVEDGEIINIKAKWRPLNQDTNINVFYDGEDSSAIYSKSRIDIKNYGKQSNDVIIVDCDDDLLKVSNPQWFIDKRGKGSILTSIKGDLNFSVKCVNDGSLDIGFRSIDFRDKNNEKIPIYIDYTDITVDDEKIVEDSTVLWHDNQLLYKKPVKDNQIVNVQVSWRAVCEESNFENIKIFKSQKENEIDDLKVKLADLKKKNEELKSLKEDVFNSNSWKLTEPLRKLKNG